LHFKLYENLEQIGSKIWRFLLLVAKETNDINKESVIRKDNKTHFTFCYLFKRIEFQNLPTLKKILKFLKC
jgi:hypothetical protein